MPSNLSKIFMNQIPLMLSFKGDSGGPLYTIDGDRAVLVGIVNRGEGCARKNSVGIYAR